MTRPQIIRADTIDLQDPRYSASAQDHSKQSKTSTLSADGRPAPHQSQALRHAEQENRDELSHSPRVSEELKRPGEEDQDGRNGSHHEQFGHNGGDILSADEDDLDGDEEDLLDDDLMDKISSSPSIDDEDIDFEFVYALHTFVATVEGQANATKGDTMVLLDDSNSYWWLVRVVKDGSIGYLPAEHIETPTERLARLNKHRNIDLSATMLGDNAEKSKNPLKKAMRRRNAKTVTFASPTYFEASDVEYSTEEEDQEDGQLFEEEEESAQAETQEVQEEEPQQKDMVVEPLRPKHQADKGPTTTTDEQAESKSSLERPRTSEDSDKQGDVGPGRSRNGVVRNTDSFFKDDSVETKKISLTPNLLRDDAASSSTVPEQKEMKGRGSLESLDKALSSDKSKDDKKRKDKKPGMLSGLFKRKDKKSKSVDDDGEDQEKISDESMRSSSPTKTSGETPREEPRVSKPQATPQRNPSKLQKAPPDTSPVKSEHTQAPAEQQASAPERYQTSSSKDNFGSSVRTVSPDIDVDNFPQPLRTRSPEVSHDRFYQPEPTEDQKYHPDATLGGTTFLNSSVSSVDVSQKYAEDANKAQSAANKENSRYVSPLAEAAESTSEVPLKLSAPESRDPNDVPTLSLGTSSPDGSSGDLHSIPSPSPELIEAPDTKAEETTSSNTAMPSNDLSWSDASLRTYLEDENDIRDLLIIVHDKSNVTPAGPDHPITGSLFKEESKQLNDMSNRLDEMLNSWLARRMATSSK